MLRPMVVVVRSTLNSRPWIGPSSAISTRPAAAGVMAGTITVWASYSASISDGSLLGKGAGSYLGSGAGCLLGTSTGSLRGSTDGSGRLTGLASGRAIVGDSTGKSNVEGTLDAAGRSY